MDKIEEDNSIPGINCKHLSKCGNHSAYYCRTNRSTDKKCISCALIKKYNKHIIKIKNGIELRECPTCGCFLPLHRFYPKTTRYKNKVYHIYSSSCKMCTSTREAEKIRNKKKKALLPVL